jgi:hypothetical protein
MDKVTTMRLDFDQIPDAQPRVEADQSAEAAHEKRAMGRRVRAASARLRPTSQMPGIILAVPDACRLGGVTAAPLERFESCRLQPLERNPGIEAMPGNATDVLLGLGRDDGSRRV